MFGFLKNQSPKWDEFLEMLLAGVDPDKPLNFRLNCLMGKEDEQRRTWPGMFSLDYLRPPYEKRLYGFTLKITEDPSETDVLYGQDLIDILDIVVNEYGFTDLSVDVEWYWKRDPRYSYDKLRGDRLSFYLDEDEPNMVVFEGSFARLDKDPFITGGNV